MERVPGNVAWFYIIPRIEFDPAGTQKAVSFETYSRLVRVAFELSSRGP